MTLLSFNWSIDLGFVVGLLGLFVSVWAMVRTRKLEKQQYKLNQYAIEDKERERDEAKHAKLKITKISSVSDFEVKLMIENQGKSDATNVKLQIENKSLEQSPKQMWFDEELPTRIGAGDNYHFVLHYWTGDSVLEVRITWEDNAGTWNKVEKVQIR